jgi:hypothetical protein
MIVVAILLTVPMLASAVSRLALPYMDRQAHASESSMPEQAVVVVGEPTVSADQIAMLEQKMTQLTLRSGGKRKLKEFIET